MLLFFFGFFYKVCYKCHTVFQDNDTKHHCRACGEGFCDGCSSKAAPVPERGWGLAPVRVCDVCFEQRASYAGTHTLNNVNCCFVLVLCSHLTFGWARLEQRYVLSAELEEEEGGTLARKVGEAVTNTIGVVVTAIDIPLGECCPKTRPKEDCYVTGIHDPVNMSKWIQCPLVAEV